jgi:uncharacterized protein (DUF4415 family)
MNKKSLTDKSGEVRGLTRNDIKKFRPASEVLPQELISVLPKRKPGQRGKQIAPKKELVTIRLNSGVVDYFRSKGPGWQTRMNSALNEWLKEHQA